MMNSKKPPYFLEVFLPGLSSDTLKVPLKFTRHMEGRTSGSVLLTGPSGHSWKVSLITQDGNLCLDDGWSTFVRDHSIQCGDSLIFRYDGNLRFSVQIFDESSCEKEEAFSATCSQQPSCCDQTVACGMKRERAEELVSSALPEPEGLKASKARKLFTPAGHLGSPIIRTRNNLHGNAEEGKLASSDDNINMQDRLRRVFSPVHLVSPTSAERKNLEVGGDGGGGAGAEELIKGMVLMDDNDQSSCSFNADNGFEAFMKPVVVAMGAADRLRVPVYKAGGAVAGKKPKKKKKAKEGKTSISLFMEKTTAQHFTSNFPFFVKVMKYSHVSGKGTLKIPVQFATAHLPKFRTNVSLHNVKGDCWTLSFIRNVGSRNVQHCFCGGWTAFVRDNGIKMGDVCIFELISDSAMCVRTLRLDLQGVVDYHSKEGGCSKSPVRSAADLSCENEKEIKRKDSHEGEATTSEMNCMTETQDAEALSCDMKKGSIPPPGSSISPAASGQISFGSNRGADLCLMLNTDEGKQRRTYKKRQMGVKDGSAPEEKVDAVSITSSFPHFMKVMRYYNITRQYTLHIPSKFCVAHLPNCKIEIVLRNLEGRSWIVNSMPASASNKSARHIFCGGWSAFVRENDVKTGDSCLFELIGERELRVQIFGVGHRALDCRSNRNTTGASEDKSTVDVDSMESTSSIVVEPTEP
ncbi:hypothetical protein Dimus_025622 [Dionaea muscipula]